MRPGFVYVIAAIDVDGLKPPTKVGISLDVGNRLIDLQQALPFEIDVFQKWEYESFKSAKQVETRFHKRFSEKRIRGEWFNVSPEDAAKQLDEWHCDRFLDAPVSQAAHDDIGHNAYLKVYPKLNIADTLGPYQRKRREWAKKFQNFGQS